MSDLAIKGGAKLRTKNFPAYNTIGEEERNAVNRVFDSGKLSSFIGSWHPDFKGGKEINALEEEWANHFGVKHAISVNSATSGLFCAVGATGINPGEEIIVSPYTMSASAVSAIVYGAIPVFADVEPDNFCLDPKSIEANITEKTKAIVVVDIFGQPYAADEINAIAKKHNLIVIEDAAQAPGGTYKGRNSGTLGDIGIYSLNYHKHIHSGEGGIIVTNNDELADKMRMIRNHAEAVIGAKGYESRDQLINMVGFNYRMTEIEAAIAREQLKKLPSLIEGRIQNADYLNKRFSEFDFITATKVRDESTHVYYLQPLLFNKEKAGVDRNTFLDAVKAELPGTDLRQDSKVLLGYGYVKPLYLLPMYQERVAFGKDSYPFNLTNRTYEKGMCPTVEDLHFNTLFTHEFIAPSMKKNDLDDVIRAFEKVYEGRTQLL